MPRVGEGTFTSTQRYALERLAVGPREYGSTDATYPLLERKGLIRRPSGPKRARMLSSDVIVWEITAVGLAMLREG